MELNNNKKIYFITVYGYQENEKKEKVDKFYKDIQSIYDNFKDEGDIYIIGDFNAKIKIDIKEKKIHQKESNNGKLLQDLINKNNLNCNNYEFEKDSWWTREGRTKETSNQKSIVDYILWKNKNSTKIDNLFIDDDLTYTLKGGKKLKGKHTDHNAIIFEIINCDTKIETNKGKIKINSRDYNHEDQNYWMRTWKYNEDFNPEENYDEWIKHANIFIKDYSKEIWINRVKRKKENSTIVALKKTKKSIENKIKNSKGKNEELIKRKRQVNKKINECTKQKVIKDINKEATKIEKASTNSKIFYKTLKRIKFKDREELDNYIIDFDGNKKEGKDNVHSFKEFFYGDLYNVREVDDKHIDWNNKIIEENNNLKKDYKNRTEYKQNNTDFHINTLNRMIKTLKNDKAISEDNISNEFIKNLDQRNRKNLLYILNKLYKEDNVPKSWREGTLTTIYKKKELKASLVMTEV